MLRADRKNLIRFLWDLGLEATLNIKMYIKFEGPGQWPLSTKGKTNCSED
jgi:hypothetical protein